MNLEQMLRAKPINASGEKEFEEKKITKPDKDDLDKAIARECKEGWLVKSRSHQADGLHGVMLVRRKVEQVIDGHVVSMT